MDRLITEFQKSLEQERLKCMLQALLEPQRIIALPPGPPDAQKRQSPPLSAPTEDPTITNFRQAMLQIQLSALQKKQDSQQQETKTSIASAHPLLDDTRFQAPPQTHIATSHFNEQRLPADLSWIRQIQLQQQNSVNLQQQQTSRAIELLQQIQGTGMTGSNALDRSLRGLHGAAGSTSLGFASPPQATAQSSSSISSSSSSPLVSNLLQVLTTTGSSTINDSLINRHNHASNDQTSTSNPILTAAVSQLVNQHYACLRSLQQGMLSQGDLLQAVTAAAAFPNYYTASAASTSISTATPPATAATPSTAAALAPLLAAAIQAGLGESALLNLISEAQRSAIDPQVLLSSLLANATKPPLSHQDFGSFRQMDSSSLPSAAAATAATSASATETTEGSRENVSAQLYLSATNELKDTRTLKQQDDGECKPSPTARAISQRLGATITSIGGRNEAGTSVSVLRLPSFSKSSSSASSEDTGTDTSGMKRMRHQLEASTLKTLESSKRQQLMTSEQGMKTTTAFKQQSTSKPPPPSPPTRGVLPAPSSTTATTSKTQTSSPSTAAVDPPKRTGPSISFPEKLYKLLMTAQAQGVDHIVSFTPSGKAFKIHKENIFISEVVPKYFRQKQLASFKRQLCMYGFDRIPRGPDEGAYAHKSFVRDQPDLVKTIRRLGRGEASSRPRPPWNPDFSASP